MHKLRSIVVSATFIPIAAGHYAQVTAVAQPPAAETRSDDPSTTRHVNSADRLLFWTSAKNIADLSDAQLDHWKDCGVGGFISMTRHLKGMGGN